MSYLHLPPEKLDCWHDCDRREAARLLLSGACRVGTYLLRPCHSRVERYALSILHENKGGISRYLCRGRALPVVRNYLIKEKNGGYYIFGDQCFREVHYLVAYYSKPRRRMRTALKYPLPRVEPAREAEAKHLLDGKTKQLHLMQKIGQGSYEVFSAELNGRRVVSLVLDSGQEIPTEIGVPFKEPEEVGDKLDIGIDKLPPPLPPRPTGKDLGQDRLSPVYEMDDPKQEQFCGSSATTVAVRPGFSLLMRGRLDRIVESMLHLVLK